MSIGPLKTTYDIGDVLNCSSEGNPDPIYKWISLANGFMKEGAQFILDQHLASNTRHLYRCTATNLDSGANISLDMNITLSINQTSSGRERVY